MEHQPSNQTFLTIVSILRKTFLKSMMNNLQLQFGEECLTIKANNLEYKINEGDYKEIVKGLLPTTKFNRLCFILEKILIERQYNFEMDLLPKNKFMIKSEDERIQMMVGNLYIELEPSDSFNDQLVSNKKRKKEQTDSLNKRNSLQKKISHYETLAEKGNELAEIYLAEIYRYGRVVERDMKKSIEYYEKSASRGNKLSMNCLGNIYFKAEGIERDVERALHFFEKSASLNDGWSISFLADFYLKGDEEGKHKNVIRAIQLLLIINNDLSFLKLAKLYLYGDQPVLSPNLRLALQYLELASKKGNGEADRIMGDIIFHGKKSFYLQRRQGEYPIDNDIKFNIFHNPRNHNNNNSDNLKEIYHNSNHDNNDNKFDNNRDNDISSNKIDNNDNMKDLIAGSSKGDVVENELKVKKDEEKGLQFFERAASRGDIQSMNFLGHLFLNNGNDLKAKFYFERASDNQDSYAQLQLAKFYKQRGNQDLEMYYLKRSSDLGRIEAIHDLALVYLEGNKFCKKDIEAAIKYLEKGVELGHSKSMVTLAVLLQDEKNVLNIPKSIQLLERAVNLQDSEAYYRLALAYKDGLEGVEMNFKKSFELLEKSSSLQNCNSMSVLGDIYWCGHSSGGFHVQKDVNLGKQYYKQSAKRLNDASLVKLSAFYENGRENFKKNLDKSADCLFSSYYHNKNDTSKSKFLHLLRSKQISWRSKFHSLWELDSPTEYVILLLLWISKHPNSSMVPFGKGVFMNIIKFVCHFNQVSKFDRFFFYKTKFFY